MNGEHLVSFASWSVLTADFLVLLHLTIGGVTLSAILHLASAKWRYRVRDIAGSMFALYPLVFVLLVVLLLGRHYTFAWMGAGAHEGGEAHPLNGWHNPAFLAAREILGLLVVGWLYRRYLVLQKVSERSEADWERFKMTANFVPVAHVLYGTMVAWDFEMTMLPSWESSVYGMYHFVSNFGMFLSTLVALGYVLSRRGRLRDPWPDIQYNYLAQLMLGFTILWTYLFFAQYLTIWYGNLPHERNRIENMVNGDYSVLWWTFFTMKFLIPFCFLVFTYFRHSPVSIFRIALVIMIGTWIERFTWIAGSVQSGAFERAHMPFTSPFDVVVTIVVIAVATVLVRRALGRNEVTVGPVGGAALASTPGS
jgi:hypothetical protein